MTTAKDRLTLLDAAESTTHDKLEPSETVIAGGAHFKGVISCPDQLLVMGSMEGDIDCGGMGATLTLAADEHGKYLLMAPSKDRAGTLGFRCAKDPE